VSKKLQDSEAIEGQEPSISAVAITAAAKGAPSARAEGVPAIINVDGFQYTYRCKHCGHEWAEIRDKVSHAQEPKGYTGD
jgi:hypothetical protein